LRGAVAIAAGAGGTLTAGKLGDDRSASAATANLIAGAENPIDDRTLLYTTVTTAPFGFGVVDRALASFPNTAALAGHTKGAYAAGVLGYAEAEGAGVRGVGALSNASGVHGESWDRGNGVYGEAQGTGSGVLGRSDEGIAVEGIIGTAANSSPAVHGSTDGAGPAVKGTGSAGPGVLGESALGPGIRGISTAGRGGLFAGDRAQVRLLPSGKATHPRNGARGDLFVDSSGRLWYCSKGGPRATWKQLA
jgi:hypothetical protein